MTVDAIRARVAAACERAGRDPAEVQVVAVSKGRSDQEILSLYRAGQRAFGENRAVELEEKAHRLPDDIEWHFVGHLQSRKARAVRPIAAYLHSLDRDSLALAWLKGAGSPPPCYLQVNVGREPQKSGVEPETVVEAARRWAGLGVPLVGLMAILPIVDHPEQARPHFQEMARLRRLAVAAVPSVTGLSMGMTDDFEVAIAEGATVVRIGRAIFGDSDVV